MKILRNDNAVWESRPEETIFIPQAARGRLLAEFQASVRLKNLLHYNRLRLVGDLHCRTFSEFSVYRGCGQKTLDELRDLVRAIQHEYHTTVATDPPGGALQGAPPPIGGSAFFVPEQLRNLATSELPLSVRLEGVLRRRGIRRLGDLHGVGVSELERTVNCGKKTIAELIRLLERAAGGEFETGTEVPFNPAELVRRLDALVMDLPDRKRKILVLRLGGKNDQVPTLQKLGTAFRLVREGVRRIVLVCINQIRRAGSRRLKSYLEQVETFCCEAVCPLTPFLLEQWLKGLPAAGYFGLAFYVRLLAELNPAIPGWPAGQEPISSLRGPSAIELGLESVLRESRKRVPLYEALRRLRCRAKFKTINVTEFLVVLQYARRLKVEFPKPDGPVVCLARHASARPDQGAVRCK